MRAAGGRYDPLPVDQAIAYVIEILPAFQYLHDMGLVYCDFKPDNIIQVGDAVKLIDLGGVRRIDDLDSAIYGTVGYQAPEVPQVGPSVASDIYTIGRTLMVLAMEFRGYQSTYVASLPPVAADAAVPEARLALPAAAKACAPDPADRFASADELRVQLLGVLREVVAARDARGRRPQHSTSSLLFDVAHGHRRAAGLGPPARRCGSTTATRRPAGCAPSASTTPAARLALLQSAPTLVPRGAAGHRPGRARGRAHRRGRRSGARHARAPTRGSGGRCGCPGLAALATDDAAGAQAAFNAVYGQVPGELAPKLALALACETSGELDVAESLYATCARTDANYIAPAAFGLARIRAAPRRPRRRARRPRPRAADQPGLHLGPAPAGRAAGRLGPGTARPRRGDGQHRRP